MGRQKKWDDQRIADLAARKNKHPYPIGELGLFVIVYPSGFRSWHRREYNDAGNAIYPKLGDFPAMGLLAAMAEFEAAEARAREAQIAQAGAAPQARPKTMAELLARFMECDINLRNIRPDRKARYQQNLTDHLLVRRVPGLEITWADVKLAESFGSPAPSARAQWAQRFEQHVMAIQNQQARGSDRRGKCTLGDDLNKFFVSMLDFARRSGWISADGIPTIDRKKINKARSVNRHLTVREIEQLLAATSEAAVLANPLMTELDACYLRLTLMTGARAEAMAIARRAMMHHERRGWWTFPAEDQKETTAQKEEPNDHHVPITALLQTEIDRLLRFLDGEGLAFDYLFPEKHPAAKARRGEAIGPRSKSWACRLCSEFDQALGIAQHRHPYTTHALRRTMTHLMQSFGVEREVREKAAGRVGIALDATYASGRMRDHVQLAFEQYHAFLLACMQGKGDDYLQALTADRLREARREEAARLRSLGINPLIAIA